MAKINVRTSPRTGEKFYQLSWAENGVQRRESLGPVSGLTPHECKIKKQAKELELSTGKPVFTVAAGFADHRDGYLDWHEGEYPTSHYRVKQIAEQHFTDFEAKALSQITTLDIEKWKAKRRKQVSAESVAKELRTLHAVLEKAVEWERGITKNPADGVHPPQNLNKKQVRYYTREQLAKLYALPLNGPMWKFVANTGLRRSEVWQLKWTQVDLKKRELHIESSDAERTKSGDFRIVPLNDSALEALAALRAERPKADRVLRRMAKGSLSRAFGIDRARCGLPRIKGSLIHALRHCYGSHHGNASVPIRTLQTLMGHADLKTTEKYVNLNTEHLHEATRKVAI